MDLTRRSLIGTAALAGSTIALAPRAGAAAPRSRLFARSAENGQAVLDWARPQHLPIVVVPGGEHFFLGRLNLLAQIVVRYCN